MHGKNLSKSSPTELIVLYMIMKLGMDGYVLYKVYINDNPELTLTYLTTMSNLAKLDFLIIVGPYIRRAFIGPLILWYIIFINGVYRGNHCFF